MFLISRFREFLARRHNVRAHFWQSLANYAQQGGAVILGVCLARLLTPEDFGAVAYAGALIGLICMPFDWTAAQVLVADRGQNPLLYSEVMSLGFIVMAAKLLATCGVVFWHWLVGEELTAILVAFAAITLVSGTAAGVMRAAAEGAGHFKPNFHVQAISLALAFFIGVGGALAGWGVYALAAMGAITAIPPFFIFPHYIPHKFHWRFNRQVIRSRGVDGFWMWLNGISMSALSRVDRLFLGKVVGDAELGNYTRAFSYANLSSWALNSFMANPAVVSLSNAPDAKKRRRILYTNGLILASGATASFVIFGLFADPIVPFIFGEQWREAIPAFKAFSLINFFSAYMWLPINVLMSKKDFKPVALSVATSVVLFCILLGLYFNSLSVIKVAYFLQLALFFTGTASWSASFKYIRN